MGTRDGSFEHQKHMFKPMDKEIITILHLNFLLNWPYGKVCITGTDMQRLKLV